MRAFRIRALLFVSVTLPGMVPGLHADAPLSHLGGRVTSAGNPAAGVTVTVTADALLQPRVTVTSNTGRYWIPALVPGEYSVTFARDGLQTVTRAARLNAGEQARVDADLLPSADGESISTTAAVRFLFERPDVVWNIHRDVFDRLPLRRTGSILSELSPLPADGEAGDLPLDALEQFSTTLAGEPGSMAVTRPASEKPFATLRYTIQDGDDLFEAAGGMPFGQRAALFAAATNRENVFVRGDLAPAARHLVRGSLHRTEVLDRSGLHYVGAFDPRFTLAASHTEGGTRRTGVRGFLSLSEHELRAGVRRSGRRDLLTLDDRWILSSRWSVTGGAEVGGSAVSPSVGATFEATTHDRISAAYADTVQGTRGFVAWGRQLQGNGYVRVAAFRSEKKERVLIDAMHDYLFLTVGGHYVIGDGLRRGRAWVIASPPTIGHRVALSLLSRYDDTALATDVALIYGRTIGRAEPFIRLEMENTFDTPRAWRVGVGVRVE
ncbi:MAG TPA: carboxypeptidase-like regulatory domain-containing protein [Thermoanaerobaculia bacterium]|nr:carboxypeptidase-like regulatory domain-containing protein [Thermoanaerobaculia bacterium]